MFLLFSVFFGIKLPNFYETTRLQNEAEATKDEKKKLNPEVESKGAAAAAAGSASSPAAAAAAVTKWASKSAA